MNSLQNHIPLSSTDEVPFYRMLELKIKGLELSEAELMLKKLKFLGLHFDPFAGDMTLECQHIIDQLGLTKMLDNPFESTNILLRLLDLTEEQINQLKQ